MKYTLVPIGMGRASLNRLVMDSEDKTKQVVVLGRNPTTGLDAGGENSIHVSRQHVELFFRGSSLCLKAVARQDGIVHLNNSACDRLVKEIHDGDTISLVGPLSFYNYAVQESSSSPLSAGAPATSNAKTDVAKISQPPQHTPVSRTGRAAQRQESNDAIVFDFTDDEPAVKRVRLNTEKREVIDLDEASPQLNTRIDNLGQRSGNDEVVSLLSSVASPARSGKGREDIDLVSTAPHSMASTVTHSSLPPQSALSANPPTSNSTTSASSTAPASNPPSSSLPNPPPAGAQEKVQSLLRQYECAICYETLASAVSLSPCGDTFCFPCISEWSSRSQSCPSCNSAFDLSHIVANRVTDNAIREILKDDVDQLAAWEARVTQGNEARKVYFEKLSTPKPPAAVPAPAPAPAPAAQQNNTRLAFDRGGVIHIDSVTSVPPRSGGLVSARPQAPQAHLHASNGHARKFFGRR